MDNYQQDNQPDKGDLNNMDYGFKVIEPDIILECMDNRGEGTCRGVVEQCTLDGIKYWPRCDVHFELRLKRYEESETERYAHSDVAPPGFDPADAGERWDDDY